MPLAPVHFFSHGSTMMLGEESKSATYWKECGDAALARGIKGVIMMGAHWDARGTNRIDVAMRPNPGKNPISYVHPSKYVDYKLNADLETGPRVIEMLKDAGFDARANDEFDWIHDTFLILIRMFPAGCPPTTLISMNGRFDPHLHARVGSAISKMREENYLIIGTGGAVHNLYRNNWLQMLIHTDNFAQPIPPEKAMLEFRQSFEDVFTRCCGQGRKKGAFVNAVTRLMKHPLYRDAHGTDDHFMAACFIAGVVDSSEGNENEKGELGAEDWELVNMCNSQFTVGKWVSASA